MTTLYEKTQADFILSEFISPSSTEYYDNIMTMMCDIRYGIDKLNDETRTHIFTHIPICIYTAPISDRDTTEQFILRDLDIIMEMVFKDNFLTNFISSNINIVIEDTIINKHTNDVEIRNIILYKYNFRYGFNIEIENKIRKNVMKSLFE